MLETEKRNPATTHIDQADTVTMLRLMQDANRRSVDAVGEALDAVGKAVDAAAASLLTGGRIIYVGAGTSGRLAVQDAAECPPTFGVDYDTVVAVMAGGEKAVFGRLPGIQRLDGRAGVAVGEQAAAHRAGQRQGIFQSRGSKFAQARAGRGAGERPGHAG